ncbi:MFS monocarboxylate transporter [Sporothrix brasiliensis 5110]|uniref:MFS monocarboxylate transporter n=1 Tax=Sporothrix brasiliensis 5110 TaxID=1398154 RepID=A0A0C2IVY8_9PEZI|nr:MFS monocarboxylate transporter [Sporothrix brasiliensis 5110]KIH93316.1 MFS monocarboxylate transporter [Sporothrix brasiliensis 5110]
MAQPPPGSQDDLGQQHGSQHAVDASETARDSTTISSSSSTKHEEQPDIKSNARSGLVDEEKGQPAAGEDGEDDETGNGPALRGNNDGIVGGAAPDGHGSGKQPEDGVQGGLLARVRSRASTTRSKHFDPGPPPDGGVQAWVAVACTHLVIMDTWGVINSFGSFQTYYTQLLGRAPSDIAWIGSFQIFLLFFIGTFTGRLTDAGYFKHLLVAGTVLQLVGIFATAQATQYWQIFLSQGVVMGLGNGCIFCPSLATVSTYFSTRRALALGLAAAGSATGGLVFPSIVRQLLPSVGFPWTMRVIGFVQLATLAVACVGLRTRLPPRRAGRLVEWSAFREPEYAFYAAGSFFCFWSIYIAFFYIASYSRDIIGLAYIDSLNLLLVINGVGAIGRLLPNYIADRVGAINMYAVFALYAAVAGFSWIAVHNTVGLYVWSVVYGIAAGGIQSLFPAGLTSLNTRDLSKSGVRIGMVFTINSIATLTGPPIAGALITADNGRYLGAQLFTGVVLLIGMCFIVCAKVSLGRSTGLGWRARV